MSDIYDIFINARADRLVNGPVPGWAAALDEARRNMMADPHYNPQKHIDALDISDRIATHRVRGLIAEIPQAPAFQCLPLG